MSETNDNVPMTDYDLIMVPADELEKAVFLSVRDNVLGKQKDTRMAGILALQSCIVEFPHVAPDGQQKHGDKCVMTFCNTNIQARDQIGVFVIMMNRNPRGNSPSGCVCKECSERPNLRERVVSAFGVAMGTPLVPTMGAGMAKPS